MEWAFMPEDAEDTEFRLQYTNTNTLHITKCNSLRNVIRSQCLKYISRVYHCPNTILTKMLFAKSRHPYKWDPWMNVAKLLNVSSEQAKRSKQDKRGLAALANHVLASVTPWQQLNHLGGF